MFLEIDICSRSEFLSIVYVVKSFFDFICMIAPILAILFISIDFFKNVFAGNIDDMNKTLSVVIRRLLFCVAVFLTPTIVSVSMNLLSDSGVEIASCVADATIDRINALKEQEDLERASLHEGTSAPNGRKSSSVDLDTDSTKIVASREKNFTIDRDYIVLGDFFERVRYYTIRVNDSSGKALDSSKYSFKSSNSGIVSVNSSGKLTAHFGGTATVTVTSRNYSTSKEITVAVVHSVYTYATVVTSGSGKSLKTGEMVNLSSGTKGVYNGTAYQNIRGGVGYTIRVKNDYIEFDSSRLKPTKYYIANELDKKTAEGFVNTQGFSSKTKYLFWTNKGTETWFMFEGSKGKWKLVKSFPVNTGDPSRIVFPDDGTGTDNQFGKYVVSFYQSGAEAARDGSWRGGVGSQMHNGAIWKASSVNSRGHGTNPWHEWGGARYPSTHGCTSFAASDLKWIVQRFKKIQGSTIIDF